MTPEEKWDELRHAINCAINFNQKRMEELEKTTKQSKDICEKMSIRHWHYIDELKNVLSMMDEIDEMEEEYNEQD